MRLRTFLALFALPIATFAQEGFQEKVTVSYVEVPVNVVGRDGGAVRGLTKANFEVYEDGGRRAIESFDAIDFASQESLRAISPLNPASRRNFLILFDLSFSNPTSIGRAQDAARAFIARSIGSRDLVAVGVVDVDRGFRFLTAFTTDRALLTAAIADPGTFRSADPLQISGTNPMQSTQEPNAAQGDIGGRRAPGDDLFADGARALNKMDDSYMRGRVRKEVESLGEIAHTLQKLAGRKHVVLLSEGFDPRLVQGRSAGETKEQNEENGFIESGEVWKVDSDKRFGNAASQMSIKLMADEFRRADVVLHAVDIKGVRVQNDVQGGARVSSNEGLFLLANPTGGTVFRNSNDIRTDFDRLSRQHEVVYVLGFRAPVGRPGQLHDLKVKLLGVPGARAQHRNGYYDTGEETSVERALTTAEVIVNDIPQTDVDVAALAAAFPAAGGDENGQVPVLLEIRGDDLVKSAKKNVATTEIFVYAFDEQGTVRDSLVQRVALDMTKVADRLRGRGVRFYGTLHLPPGRFAVKSLVRVAETDRRGYQRVDVTVPAAGDVALAPPLFFAGPGSEEWVMVKSSRDSAKTPYPFVLDGQSFIPAARAALKKGEPRLFTVFVFNADPDELTWEIAPQARLVSSTAGEAVTKYVFALDAVPANATELGVTIRKKGSTDARHVTVPISVQ
jgi:VWFA-related protein